MENGSDLVSNWRSRLSGVAFILFDLRKDPVEFARGDLATAEFADSRGVNFQRRAAIRAVQIRVCGPRLGFAAANERPILAPTAQFVFGAGHHAPIRVNCVIETLSKDSKRYRVIESIFLNLRRLHSQYLVLVEGVAQPLTLVRVDPVAMHLEDVIGFVRSGAFPAQR